MTYTYTWDATFEANPDNSDYVQYGAQEIRELKEAINERMAKEHQWDLANNEEQGEHLKMTLEEISEPSTPDSNKIIIYAADDGGTTELYAKDADDSITLLTHETIVDYDTDSTTLDGHWDNVGDPGYIYATTIGRMIFLDIDQYVRDAGALYEWTSGVVIQSAFRPDDTKYTMNNYGVSWVQMISMESDGGLRVIFRNWGSGGAAHAIVYAGCLTYKYT